MKPDEKCRSCGAPIIWARSNKSGKYMPLDQAEVTEGVRFVVGYKDGVPYAYNEKISAGHASHFATCPNASAHRTKPDGQGELL